jgi:hypothetical protein
MQTLTGFDLAAVFLTIVGGVGWLNACFWQLPSATAMVLAGLASGRWMIAVSLVIAARFVGEFPWARHLPSSGR